MLLQQWLVPSALGYLFHQPQKKMGLATLSYTTQGNFLTYQELRYFQGRKGCYGHFVRPAVSRPETFSCYVCQWAEQLVSTRNKWLSQQPLPVQRAGGGHVCPADAGTAIPENSSSTVELLCRALKWWESNILGLKMYSLTLGPTSTHWNKFYPYQPKPEPHSYFQVDTWKSVTHRYQSRGMRTSEPPEPLMQKGCWWTHHSTPNHQLSPQVFKP